jgi:hypothetical protein
MLAVLIWHGERRERLSVKPDGYGVVRIGAVVGPPSAGLSALGSHHRVHSMS